MSQINRTIAIGSDHAGLRLKNDLVAYLSKKGYQVLDQGPQSTDSVDYPDFGFKVASLVQKEGVRGVLVCGSGVGISIVGNKVAGVRAALCHDRYTAQNAREQLDCNVIAFGDRVTGNEVAQDALNTFLNTEFKGGEKQLLKLKKLQEIEAKNLA